MRALGIRLRGIDLLLGALVALVARAVVELITPTSGSLLPALDADAPGARADAAAGVVATVVVVVVVSPLIEELFFRGALQRALQAALPGPQRPAPRLASGLAAGVAVTLTTVLFVLLHAVPAGADVPLHTVLAPLVVGLGAGVLTAVTGRIGAGATAHVLFNASGVLLLLL